MRVTDLNYNFFWSRASADDGGNESTGDECVNKNKTIKRDSDIRNFPNDLEHLMQQRGELWCMERVFLPNSLFVFCIAPFF